MEATLSRCCTVSAAAQPACGRRGPALVPRRRPAIVCRAEMGPEDRDTPAEAQWQWNGPSFSSSSSSEPTLGAGASSSGDQQRQWPAEELLSFSPDLHMPPVLVQDWRAFRARLVAMESGQAARAASLQLGVEEHWAHVLSAPERGCLLVARPRPGLGMFHNTVILLLEHDDAEGSSGLVINMPTPLLISGLGLEEEISEAFRNCPLYVGGPVTKNLLHVLHGRRDVEGALEVIEGVFAGGVESASELVRAGEADAKEFMLLAGYSGWGPWQLAHELAGGTWLPIATSQPVIMDILKESLSYNPTVVEQLGVAGGASADDLKALCWRRVLKRVGIEPHMLGML